MKRRKKYSAHKNIKRSTQSLMQDYLIIWSSFSGGARLFDRRGNQYSVSDRLHHLITNYRYKWTLHIAAFGLDHSDKIYMKSETIQSNEEYTHSELCDFLNKEHYALIESVNPQRRIAAGWIATIGTKDMTEDQIYKWFERIGLNDDKSMPEVQQHSTGIDSHAVSQNM